MSQNICRDQRTPCRSLFSSSTMGIKSKLLDLKANSQGTKQVLLPTESSQLFYLKKKHYSFIHKCVRVHVPCSHTSEGNVYLYGTCVRVKEQLKGPILKYLSPFICDKSSHWPETFPCRPVQLSHKHLGIHLSPSPSSPRLATCDWKQFFIIDYRVLNSGLHACKARDSS